MLDAPTICVEDHRAVMGMISDDLKTAYSVTPVQRLRNLRNGVDWEWMESATSETLLPTHRPEILPPRMDVMSGLFLDDDLLGFDHQRE